MTSWPMVLPPVHLKTPCCKLKESVINHKPFIKKMFYSIMILSTYCSSEGRAGCLPVKRSVVRSSAPPVNMSNLGKILKPKLLPMAAPCVWTGKCAFSSWKTRKAQYKYSPFTTSKTYKTLKETYIIQIDYLKDSLKCCCNCCVVTIDAPIGEMWHKGQCYIDFFYQIMWHYAEPIYLCQLKISLNIL